MATYYLDYEGGNDANTGLSFAQRWKTFTTGATAARIAPGDTIRVMASPDPTSVGTATWTDGPRPAAASVSSSTNATPIVITTAAAHGLVAGDYVSITGHLTNTNANGVWKVGTVGSATTFQILQMDGTNTTGNGVGSTGTFQKATNSIIKLASPVTQNIALCGGLGQKPTWTTADAVNVTCTQNTTAYKEGYSSAQIAIGAGFATGKAAYYTLPSTLNLSGYQQVSFWVQQTAGTLGAAGAVYLALCSDTLGATVVNTVNIPAIAALSVWQLVTVDLGTNLGSSIQSVAFYVATDNAAQTFLIDNIVACKASASADSLTLSSLLSKNTGNESWFPIQSINYDAVMIANTVAGISTATTLRGYMGTTETVTTYKLEPIKITPAATTTASVNTMTESGTATAITTYSGGWNRTDMSTQTGETWYDGQNGNGYCYAGGTGVNYVRTDKLNAVRYNTGWRVTPTSNYGGQIGSGKFVGCTGGITTANSNGNNFDSVWVNNNSNGLSLTGNCGTVITTVYTASNNAGSGISNSEHLLNITTVVQAHNNGVSGVLNTGNNVTIDNLTSNYNAQYAVNTSSARNCVIGGGSTTGNSTAGMSVTTGTLFVSNVTINEATEFASYSTLNNFSGPSVYASRLDNTSGNNWVFAYNGTVNQQSSVVDSPATTAWKMSPTTASVSFASSPIALKLGTVICAAGSLVTVTARMQRSNTGLTMRLIRPAGQIDGGTTDVYSDMTAAANTWETVTITFTPTNAGGVDIYAHAFGGSSYSGYVCNLTASQA